MIAKLIFIANEMKCNAQRRVIDPIALLASENPPKFPPELTKHYDGFHIQFSIDRLSKNKLMHHLSFAKLDDTDTSEEERKEIELAFFGKEENLLRFPGRLKPYVYHVASLENQE